MFSEILSLRGVDKDSLHPWAREFLLPPVVQDQPAEVVEAPEPDAGEWDFVPADNPRDVLRTAVKNSDQERAARALAMKMQSYKEYSREAEEESLDYLYSAKANLKKAVLLFLSIWLVYFLLTFIRNGKNPFSS